MMSHWVCKAPERATAVQLIDALRGAGVGEDALSVVANKETPLDDLPAGAEESDALVESDVVPAATRGAALGAGTGLLAGLAAVAIAPVGLVVAGAGIALGTATGASFGAFASALVGTSVPNSELREFREALDRGEMLVVVDADAISREDLQALISSQAPGAHLAGDTEGPPPVI